MFVPDWPGRGRARLGVLCVLAFCLLLAGGCGDTNGKPQIEKTDALQRAYQFGKTIYENE